jgi:hypothetical protein
MTKPEDDTVSAVYGSGGGGNYLKWQDLQGDDWELVITAWEKKLMDQKDFNNPGETIKKLKVVLSFAGEDRKLVLNVTNANAISTAYGEHFSDWIGKNIILFQGDWKGDPCLRVRTPKVVKKVAPKAQSENPGAGLDDEIPF